MKKITAAFVLSLLSITGFSQALPPVTLCLGDDATVCQGQQVTINNCTSGGGSGAAGINLNAPTSVSLSDDVWSGTVNIGFPFSFYGNTYSQCVIGSNGLISFNTANANGYCPWSLTGGPLPNGSLTGAQNSIMLTYQDINPSLGGQIQYQTIGTAPNRQFVVLYKNIYMFSCTSQCNYMAIVLYESSNNFELHIGNKPICTSWNSGLAIQGSENNAMTIAHITPGRNNSVWGANQDGRRFTPTSPSNTASYTMNQIPYIMVNSPGSNYVWGNTLGQTFPYNNGVLNVNQVPPGTTGYFLAGSACGASIGAISDTTWLTRVSTTVTASSTPDICSSGIGTVTATPGLGTAPFNFTWPTLGASGPTVTGVPGGTYTVLMTDSNGCPSSATVVVGNTPASFSGSTTTVSCPGGSDGTATAVMTPPLGTVSYLWNDPLAQNTATATGLAAGDYTCIVTSTIGCTGTVNVTVTEIPGIIATFANQEDVTCNSGNDGILEVSVTQGTPGYTYSWDNSASTSALSNDLFAGTHTVTITDLNNCVITLTGTISEPLPLQITTLTSDTQICPENTATLEVTGTGGSSPYLFTWSANGQVVGSGTSITVDPEFTNTQYCVVLSEQCGSPTTDSCMLVYFPTPIEPRMTPDKVESCLPGEFTFTNTSVNSSEIATMYVEFSEGSTHLLNGTDPVTITFETPNFYSVDMTATSVYGCVYTGSHMNIVEVKPLPIADFTFSANPTTFFETSIMMQDRSSFDVIDWEWSSPGSTPSYSNAENPTFQFPEGEVGVYPVTLTVTTENGCVDTVTYMMNVVSAILFYAPNTFTPDNDEYNNTWKFFISGIDIYNFDLFIFNRWGEVIWESHDPAEAWDGTYKGLPVQEGTYTWKAAIKEPYNDGKKEYNGYINVIR